MKKFTKEELEETLFTIDLNDPDDWTFTREYLIKWAIREFAGKGEFEGLSFEGKKYSIIIAPIE